MKFLCQRDVYVIDRYCQADLQEACIRAYSPQQFIGAGSPALCSGYLRLVASFISYFYEFSPFEWNRVSGSILLHCGQILFAVT